MTYKIFRKKMEEAVQLNKVKNPPPELIIKKHKILTEIKNFKK